MTFDGRMGMSMEWNDLGLTEASVLGFLFPCTDASVLL